MKNVFITGVSGYLGGKAAQALSVHSDVEKIIGIDIREPSFQLNKFGFIKQDVREPVLDILKEHDIDTIIHAAYVLPPGHDTKNIEDINVFGTKNIFSGAREAGVSQILYTSSTTAYGFYPDNEFPLTENSPLRGNDDFTYSKNKKEIESIVKTFVQENEDICITVLRPCYVAGPGLDNPLSSHLKKRFVMLPRETSPFQYVHEDDLIRVMVMCLEKQISGIFNVAGAGTISFTEMVRILGNTPLLLPDLLINLLNGMAWHLRLKFLTEFPNPALNLMKYRWIASSEKLIRETGFKFEYDTMEAYKDFAQHVLTQQTENK
jgi:UDP-glucose 4-epimerase